MAKKRFDTIFQQRGILGFITLGVSILVQNIQHKLQFRRMETIDSFKKIEGILLYNE